MNLRRGHRRTPVERFEDMVQLGGLDSHAFIFNADLDLLAPASFTKTCSNADPGLWAAILHRIGDQVLQALRKGREVAGNLRQIGFNMFFDDYLLRLDQTGRILQRCVQYLRYLERAKVIEVSALPGGGKQQNLLDQLIKLLPLVLDYVAVSG